MRIVCLFLSSLCLSVSTLHAEEPHPGAEAFVESVVAEHGLDPEAVRAVLAEARYQQSIIDAITRPAESKPWYEYRPIFMTEARIGGGAEFWRANQALVEQVASTHGVPAEIILAIVGVETNYGMITGRYRVIDALATLGFYYPRRAEFFASELGHFLRLAQEEDLPVTEVLGSYAGAMGIGQFIPSSYRAYAVDFDDSGHRDLWRSLPDALGSVANYLAVHGWQAGQPIVLPVEAVPDGLEVDFSTRLDHDLAELAAMGIEFDQAGLPDTARATLVELETRNGPEYWIGLNNFYVITRYNRSPLYAMAVTQLSEAIAERAP
ncbi:lytic murein transglycosylase B [Wenzhouxiangella marina]|uniref:Membrane-bound lytic murein transglycosylase B n=1 Tax=Wenzhouxiangella marina TaxID=1579979 RepID=A0A0K0XSI5_9GAMM|nr:lytic murein transglycosylase B [Wenzhouxiangella marina]AKS40620.1 Membrane-bound lytic murein transglycosylase B [Wenzhouxiangella marina]MBB6088388.1 membrane-bound lytic murein transglycosylase B [Wenzhouxiangella marina]